MHRWLVCTLTAEFYFADGIFNYYVLVHVVVAIAIMAVHYVQDSLVFVHCVSE
jgi:hypothetical protein